MADGQGASGGEGTMVMVRRGCRVARPWWLPWWWEGLGVRGVAPVVTRAACAVMSRRGWRSDRHCGRLGRGPRDPCASVNGGVTRGGSGALRGGVAVGPLEWSAWRWQLRRGQRGGCLRWRGPHVACSHPFKEKGECPLFCDRGPSSSVRRFCSAMPQPRAWLQTCPCHCTFYSFRPSPLFCASGGRWGMWH